MSEAGEGRAVWEKGNVWETPDRFFPPREREKVKTRETKKT